MVSFRVATSARLIIAALALSLAACDDNDDPLDPADLPGSYVLSPAPSITCAFAEEHGGAATLTFTELEVAVASDDEISGLLSYTFDHPWYDFDGGVASFSGDRTGDAFTVMAQADLNTEGAATELDLVIGTQLLIEGAFTSGDRFEARVTDVMTAVSLVSEELTAAGDCAPLDVDVTGTRR